MKEPATPQERYDATHTKKMTFKFNLGTDADILARFDHLKQTGESVQGYIKTLIRRDMEKGTR